MSNKKAFDLPRDSVYVAEPITQLRILGGKGILADDEAGDLDTEATADMSIKDLKRLSRALPIPFKRNIAKRGVKTPIIVVKLDGIIVVLEGKSRVRAARAANRLREEAGEPLIKVRCVIQRDTSPMAMLDTMVTSNNGRMEDDFSDKLEKLTAMIDGGQSQEDCADAFNVSVKTIQGMLSFTDNATPETKAAVKEGRLKTSAAAEVARVKDPIEQNKMLEGMLSAKDPKARSVKAARQARGAKNSRAASMTKKDITTLLDKVRKTEHPRAAQSTLDKWEGIEQILRYLVGEDDLPAWLTNALA